MDSTERYTIERPGRRPLSAMKIGRKVADKVDL